jgi:ATP-dependent Clp protease adaptor protein ClpS
MSDTAVLDEPVVQQKPVERTRDRQKPKRQPPYVVIVHNDNEHTFDYVIELLQRICGHPLEKAVDLTFTVHNVGQAAVWTGPKEVAELKRDQIRGFGPDLYARKPVRFPLGVTIEPLPEG